MSSVDVKAEYAGLFKAAANGDRGTMEALLMGAQEVAYRFSLLVCGHPEDAEDVMQDALLETYQHVATISEPEAFRTWRYSTVRNACLMKRRRRVGEPSNFVSVEGGTETSEGTVYVDVADPSRSIDQRLLDGELDTTACQAIEQHCLGCASCAALVSGLRETVGLCRQAGTVSLPDAVRQRARESVRRLLDRHAREG